MKVNDQLKIYAEMTEAALEKYLPAAKTPFAASDTLIEAMRYSLIGGGKRIRAALCLEFCRLCGGDPEAALPFACAIEMAHAYSLIHDDLPCMDDDDMRRGKPSCHVAYGEATAVLAGDALQSLAFETASSADLPADRVAAALKTFSACIGCAGMCGGQAMDLDAESVPSDEATLIETSRKKTGAMIVAASKLGCIAAGAEVNQIYYAEKYASALGLSFQMIDDVLDVESTAAELGKPIGSDEKSGKTTFVSLFGVEETMKKASLLTESAKAALSIFGNDAKFLKDLADYLYSRRS
ncbi:MAG: polyprenyl synthetase family protein [Clostridia bacterium]|nr:polyprenyl synthetase family protein [Clostridia bacterium]